MGFPLARLVMVICLATGAALDMAVGPAVAAIDVVVVHGWMAKADVAWLAVQHPRAVHGNPDASLSLPAPQVVLTVLDSIEARMTGQLTPVDELAIIGGVGIAMADAAIDAWFYKYAPTHMMWRPAVGVRNAVPGNGLAIPDWVPLGRPDTNGSHLGKTPDFPAYPSGHATFGAAAFQLLRLFLVEKGAATFDPQGVDDVSFDFVSDEFNGRNKDAKTMQPRDHLTLGHKSLWQAITDNSVSRVYLGVHWQFDGITERNAANTEDEFGVPLTPSALGQTGGVWLGAKIANEIAPKLGVSVPTINASRIS